MMSQILLLAATLAWGASFFLSKGAIEEVGIASLMFWRFLIVAALSSVVLLRHVAMGLDAGPRIRKAGVTLSFFLFLTIGLQMLGMVTVTASRASFLTALYVPLTPLVAFFILRTPFSYRQVVVVLIAMLGTLLMTVRDGLFFQALEVGDFILMVSALAAAFHIVLVEKYARAQSEQSLQLGLWQFLGCFAWVALACLVLTPWLPPQSWNPLHWSGFAKASVLFNAFVTTAFAFMVQIYAQKRVGSLKAALIFALEAPFASFFAFIFLGERLGLFECFGAALVFLAGIIPEGWLRKKHGTL